jgi:acyl-[acyl-carrier-protein]-phospholipid O-acyltransferase/long-chain-fatty-acid--[acyl-carrier-protein] ligase
MLKKILHALLTLLFRIEVKGLEHYDAAGKRVLIISNHTSFLDPLFLGVFLPDDITFAINTHISRSPLIKPFLRLSKVFVLDPTQPLSLKSLIQHLKTDKKTVIFPEGRITVTGSLMKIYAGTGMVADRADAMILPIRIDGAEFTPFSRLKKIVRIRLFPKITITILPPTKIAAPEELKGKQRRHYNGRTLSDLMTHLAFTTSHYQQTIFSKLLQARIIHGGKHIVADDLERTPLTYDRLITRTIIIGDSLKKISASGENLGVLLPNSTKSLVVVLGIQLHGRVPAMLNYSIGSTGMLSACHTAKIKTVLTSRRFIELGKLNQEAEHLSQHLNLVYLEDLVSKITWADKLRAFWQCKTADSWYTKAELDPHHPAVVLFTSGTEGSPKGVVLSHQNILANHEQVASRINFNAQDIVLNFLPMFHSFGFTVGTLLPIMHGMTTFFYPSPLHYSVIPEIAYEKNATIMFGTNTFLAAYGKKAHPYDFYKIRYVVAGAEKLQDNTRQLWSDKFGIRILEGYGATETSPVAAVNTPMENKIGSVGRLMPSMKYQLEAIPGIENAGKLHLAGPNIMQGYLLADNPGKLVPPESIYGKGWYDTGDIVHIDEDGFISIQGRSKRFAKISGEMVSLAATEQIVTEIWPEHQHAIVSLPDERKGEQLVLVTTFKDPTIKELIAKAKGIAAINLPRKFIEVDKVPVMATGKINYIEATELAKQKLT